MIIVCFNDPDSEKGIFIIRESSDEIKQEFEELASMDSSEGNMQDCKLKVNLLLAQLVEMGLAQKSENRFEWHSTDQFGFSQIYFFSF